MCLNKKLTCFNFIGKFLLLSTYSYDYLLVSLIQTVFTGTYRQRGTDRRLLSIFGPTMETVILKRSTQGTDEDSVDMQSMFLRERYLQLAIKPGGCLIKCGMVAGRGSSADRWQPLTMQRNSWAHREHRVDLQQANSTVVDMF